MDGILNIDKPPGITSFAVVAAVKRLTGEKHVGHAGTLDPAASGVLPVCLGRGTRVIEFLADATKTYRAEIELGVATDTYDAEGKVTQQGDPTAVTRSQVDSALGSFRGTVQQVPPLYSALKYNGKPLYELARAGITVELNSRPVSIYRLELVEWQPPLVTAEVVCSKGTYIRSLAHDLGQLLGCGAHLKSLVRLKYGLFDIKEAVSLSGLEDAVTYGFWQRLLYPIDSPLSGWPSVTINDDEEKYIKNGRPLVLGSGLEKAGAGNLQPPLVAGVSSQNLYRAYASDGSFLAVLRFNPESGYWEPRKVFLPLLPQSAPEIDLDILP